MKYLKFQSRILFTLCMQDKYGFLEEILNIYADKNIFIDNLVIILRIIEANIK